MTRGVVNAQRSARTGQVDAGRAPVDVVCVHTSRLSLIRMAISIRPMVSAPLGEYCGWTEQSAAASDVSPFVLGPLSPQGTAELIRQRDAAQYSRSLE